MSQRRSKTRHDITGQKFSRLTVISLIGVQKRHRVWSCLCECGRHKNVRTSNLVCGKVRSCGCLAFEKQRENAKYRYGAANSNWRGGCSLVNVAIGTYKREARRRGIVWGLSDDEAAAVIIQPCAYCGEPASNGKYLHRNGSVPFYHNGIDRIDNSRGYEIGNVVPCCKYCNFGKFTQTLHEWKSRMERILSRWAGIEGTVESVGRGRDITA